MPFRLTRKTGEMSLGDNAVLKWQRRLRKIFFVLIAVSIVWFFVQIGRYSVAVGNDAMKGTFGPGTSVVYDRFFDWHNGLVPFFGVKNRSILRGNVVIFLKRNLEITNAKTGEKQKGDYYGISRAVGLPGDTIRFTPKGVVIGEKEGEKITERLFPAPHNQGSTEAQEIPPDRFFLLNDNFGSEIQDGRHFGYVRGGELRGKVLGALKFW